MSVQVENAKYFHMASSPMDIFYDEELTRLNSENEAKGAKRLKMREFMSVGLAAWNDLGDDQQTPFLEKYKELCNKAGVEPKLPKEKEAKKPKKAKKETKDKENSVPMDVEDAENMDVEESEEKAKTSPKKRKKAEEPKEQEEEPKEEPKDKKPASSYFRWLHGVNGQNGFQKDFKAQNPDADRTAVKAAIAEAWAAVDAEEKAELQAAFKTDMAAWEERNPDALAEKKAEKAAKKPKVEKEEVKDKKPQGPYFRWMNGTFRAEWKAANPDVKGITELSKAAGVAWKTVDQEVKDELQSEYDAEMKAWRLRNGKPEPVEKEPKVEKPPKNVCAMFVAEEFRATFKAENAEAKAAEVNTAGAKAFEELSEEDKATWEAKYVAKLAELGVDREEHEKAKASPEKKKKLAKSGEKMFEAEEFAGKYLEENPETKKASKEFKDASAAAWGALTDEVREEWEAKWKAMCEEMGVSPEEAAKVEEKPKKAQKPKLEKTRTWKELYLETQSEKISKAKPTLGEEEVQKEAELRLKNSSKSEKMGYQDRALVMKKKAEKALELALEAFNKEQQTE